MKKLLLLLLLVGCKFSEVEKYQVYRSPQPTIKELETAITKYGLKTIINLRGANPGETWWEDQNTLAKAHGVVFINIAMSADRLPHRADLIKLLDAFHKAPRPMLIHCKAGVDRTGEAAALYQMIFMNKTKEEALEMLSPEYGHYEGVKPAKRYFIEHVWQGEEWARTAYNPCSGQFKYYNLNTPECQ